MTRAISPRIDPPIYRTYLLFKRFFIVTRIISMYIDYGSTFYLLILGISLIKKIPVRLLMEVRAQMPKLYINVNTV